MHKRDPALPLDRWNHLASMCRMTSSFGPPGQHSTAEPPTPLWACHKTLAWSCELTPGPPGAHTARKAI